MFCYCSKKVNNISIFQLACAYLYLRKSGLKQSLKNYGAKVDRFESLSKRKNGFTASFPGPKTHTKKTNPIRCNKYLDLQLTNQHKFSVDLPTLSGFSSCILTRLFAFSLNSAHQISRLFFSSFSLTQTPTNTTSTTTTTTTTITCRGPRTRWRPLPRIAARHPCLEQSRLKSM